MSKNKPSKKSGGRRERRVRIRSELRKTPDLQKIANAVLALALAQAEKDAQAEAAARNHENDEPQDEGASAHD